MYRQELHGRILSLKEDASAVLEASDALKTSSRLRDFLHAALLVGNAMNDTSAEEVAGFALSSLPKLAETKGFDGKTTALDFVVQTLCRSGKREGASFLSDIESTCSMAMRAPLPQMKEDLAAVQDSQKRFDGAVVLLEMDAAEATPVVCKGQAERPGSEAGSSSGVEAESAGRRLPVQQAAEEAVLFQGRAKTVISATRTQVAEAESAYVKMLDYFGEPSSARLASDEFFRLILHSGRAAKASLDKHDRLEKANARGAAIGSARGRQNRSKSRAGM